MQVRYILWLVRKWFWLIALAMVIGGAAGLAVNLFQARQYEATITLYVSTPNASDYQSELGAQQAAKAFVLFPQSDEVLQDVLNTSGIHNLSVSQLSSMVTASNNTDSQFVVIKVRNSNPVLAAQLASMIATQSISLFMSSQSGFQLTVFQQGQIPQTPIGLGPAAVLSIGMFVGLLAIFCVILFFEQTTGIVVIRPGEKITVLDQETGLPTVITVKGPLIKEPQAKEPPVKEALTAEVPESQQPTVKLSRFIKPERVDASSTSETPANGAAFKSLYAPDQKKGASEHSEP